MTVTSCSLALLACLCWGGPYADLAAKMRAASSDQEAVSIFTNRQDVNDFPEASTLEDQLDYKNVSFGEKRKQAQTLVDLRAMAETDGSVQSAEATAKAVKSSSAYRDPGVEEGTNWLGMTLERLKNLRFQPQMPRLNSGGGPKLGSWVTYVLWTILAIGVAVFVYLAMRHLDWKRTLARRAKAMLEENEPERSLDEWLEAADRLAAEGKYREAVRALYLACLLKFDEGRVARFDRRETNWEHLARIERSPNKPAEIDFRVPTQAFDTIWYGYRTEGMPDVVRFRAWYQVISKAVAEAPK